MSRGLFAPGVLTCQVGPALIFFGRIRVLCGPGMLCGTGVLCGRGARCPQLRRCQALRASAVIVVATPRVSGADVSRRL